jgi:NAD(P)-dependent dehydrogenase (short-subunit alcohol dehydrogenase family)
VRLRGASVVVTGAAGGIGAALAARYAREGARLALLDRDAPGLAARTRELAAAGAEALALPCDVTDPEACRAAIARVELEFGGVDVLVNNAGITALGLFRDTSVEVLRRVLEVNFFGAVHCTQAALASLLARRGQIVVLSSVAGVAPLAGRAAYAASKHALHGLFESLRAEHRGDGLRVLMVCPSFVATGIGDAALAAAGGPAAPGARTGAGHAASPERVADAIVRAALRGRRLLLVPREARLAIWTARLAPGLYERLMLRRTRQEASGG